MLNKKIICVVIFLFFITAVHATITDYNVPTLIPLDRILSISGKISPPTSGVVCSFLIYDTDNSLIFRLSDEKTVGNGIFASNHFVLTEPMFLRGNDYNAVTTCDTDVASKTFRVDNRQALLAYQLNKEVGFFGNQANQEGFFAIIIFIGLFAVGGGILYLAWKKGNS